ncbi:MAG: radical SAM protein [Nitrospirae bacterium CG_4_10_14_0_8_um_filter_41_23]|nr:MAG: radical SAM protein [Nitrospirae bacterium CG11_big_fil_rev_8_21_14_0_20_41_14]PIV43533.1 MAG: radical SAM protein [Nitrospirae bacterium CG02_land_8_20_14_3_00_41_53]PIW88192.1 MAG: radical SAM protein [Nitrospirae bacterium CG_4_8_14_3_um_filter_41_47]PIY86523.1 MAG: radical SAM protein [Nitrospirae bacterium CG_4_10_14_0_8_um_filter_41_23]PJA79840.1 MAG: radical SAM protein [Nitrospirae bacterium CG_4_9_14_3_um_filter_41_27]
MSDKIRKAEDILKKCTLCPRKCEIDRTSEQRGFCRTGDKPFISSWGPHFGEERPLVGKLGSGTIFFGNCNLDCIFCQNYSISHLGEGSEISFEKLADIMLSLQHEGCHNINLVTPAHQTPMILRSLRIASEKGLNIPIVYNCGGYESLQTIRLLDGIVDIYMPDFKYSDPDMALRYSNAEDYPEAAKAAIKEMHKQVGDLLIDNRGIAMRGLLVRHLVLPEGIAGTAGVVKFIAGEVSKDTYINIMDQYHPCFKAFDNPPLDRRITGREYSEAIRMAVESGLTRIDGITA